ncbi:MAG: MscS Mechanosensitive ion channel [Candidatus Krumholzibacteriota bacterium]|nr:MscS Mechanosensitive ion channel [Candidatus Krumholzibacteriota bacterium]
MSRLTAIALALVLCVIAIQIAAAQESPRAPSVEDAEIDTAPVKLDGEILFFVRGIGALSPESRARAIGKRIRGIAGNADITPDSIVAVEVEGLTRVMAGRETVMAITQSDLAVERLTANEAAVLYLDQIRKAVVSYRSARNRATFTKALLHSALWTVVLIGGLIVFLKLYRRLWTYLENKYKGKLDSLRTKSLDIVSDRTFWGPFKLLLRAVRIVIVVIIIYTYIELVLGSFPWTRFIAVEILNWVQTPLQVAGQTIADEIPNLIFLAIAWFITRVVLHAIKLFFVRVEARTISLASFDPEWSMPTYNLVRVAVVAFAIIVCYPYVPGSDSEAFKGISIFIGVLVSLGSSSAVSNLIAGYMLIYRRAYKAGDLVQINDVRGVVTERRLQVTHLRTIKNEEIVIPNSIIINSSVMNYSTVARESGLILHTQVTIGYDTPWRQVNALLLLAAERTKGVLKEPKPFVWERSLDDFFVTYELNAYTDAPREMMRTYSELHRHILDAFNEHGVQITSPHYEGDPANLKVVPKEKWFSPPADGKTNDAAGPSRGGLADGKLDETEQPS